jgi:hypothetical protein
MPFDADSRYWFPTALTGVKTPNAVAPSNEENAEILLISPSGRSRTMHIVVQVFIISPGRILAPLITEMPLYLIAMRPLEVTKTANNALPSDIEVSAAMLYSVPDGGMACGRTVNFRVKYVAILTVATTLPATIGVDVLSG